MGGTDDQVWQHENQAAQQACFCRAVLSARVVRLELNGIDAA